MTPPPSVPPGSEMSGILLGGLAIGFGLVFAAMVMALVRLARGPSLPDRVVALDLMATLLVAFLALFTIYTGHIAFLDVAISMALVAFLGTVAFARFAERRRDVGSAGVPAPRNRSDAGGAGGG